MDRPRGLRWHGREALTGEGLRAVAVPPGAHLAGLLAALVGAWGALSVFVGPAFGWSPTTNSTWTWSTQNWMLHLVPGAVGFAAGLMILMASPRRLAGGRGVIDLAALVAVAAGAWFVVGPALWATFESGTPFQSAGPTNEFWYQLGSSIGPGLALTFLGGMALKAGIARAGVAVAEPVRPATAMGEPITAADPMAEGPMAERPVADTRMADRPVADTRMADRPVAEDPVAERPVTEGQTTARHMRSADPGTEMGTRAEGMDERPPL